jgi:septal ring factor EnvC (AmiA/AmiB activator)
MPAKSPTALRAAVLFLAAIVAALAYAAYHLDSVAAHGKEQLALADSKIGQAKADLGMANARSAELQLQIESIGSQTADLKAQLDKAQARQSGLESQLQRALADLRSQADNARVRESDFQAVIKSSHDASSGLLKELEQAKSQAKDLEAQLAKTQGDLAKLQPLAIKARVPPLTTSFEKGFWDRGFTLHVKNLNPDPLSVNIKITGLGTAFARSATMEGGGSLNVENLAAGMRVAIESAGYDTMTVTVQ